MHIDLSGKTALVTGASRGIGRQIALQLGQAGATVAVQYRSQRALAEELITKLPVGSVAFQADLSQTQEVSKLYENVSKKFGPLNILVNNAGVAISSAVAGKDENWLADWNKTIQTNLSAAAYLSKKFVEDCLAAKKQGRIINITSRAAYRGDTEDYLAYASSKAGLAALTSSIARAFGKRGIIAFNIAPGFVQTEMAQDFIDQYGKDYALSDINMPKLTQPEDIANMVVFLASGLGDHALGSSIHINAGSYIH